MARMVTARMAGLRPGTSPPPVRMPMIPFLVLMLAISVLLSGRSASRIYAGTSGAVKISWPRADLWEGRAHPGSKRPGRFFVQPPEEVRHDLVPVAGDPLALGREHPALDLAQLDQEFAIGGVLFGVGFRLSDIDLWIMKPGSHLAGKKERSPDADGADRIQLVGVKQDPSFQGVRNKPSPVAVGLDAADNPGDPFGSDPVLPQNLIGQDRAFLGVTGPAVRQVLLLPADVVEQCGELEDVEVGLFLAADAEA